MPVKHPGDCGGELTDARQFNLMFKTFMGPVEEDANVVFMRPETAQGMFVNFANVLDTVAQEAAPGIAQTGKSFRNEITLATSCSAPASSSRWRWSSSSPGEDMKW